MMRDVVGYNPENAAGNLTSGSSMASLIAAVVARDNFDKRNASKCVAMEDRVVYVSQQVHNSIIKCLHIAGMGRVTLRKVNVDGHFKMDINHLTETIAKDKEEGKVPFMLVGTAGTTNTGSVDPMQEMVEISKTEGMWFHVDAAYGGFFLLCPELREMFKGISEADSISMDLHKSLFVSFGSGAVLVKQGRLLKASFTLATQNSYMQDQEDKDEVVSPCQLSPELSRHFRGLRAWIPLKLFGVEPFRAALREKIMLANYAYDELANRDGIEVGPRPQLSILLFRFVGGKNGEGVDETSKMLFDMILDEGTVFLSSTNIGGRFWLRLAVLNHRTHLEQVKRALEAISCAINNSK